MEQIRELRNEKIIELYEKVNTLNDGSEEQLRLIKEIAELERIEIEDFKAQTELFDKQGRLEMDREKFESEMSKEHLSGKEKFINWISEAKAETIIIAMMSSYTCLTSLNKALKFEASGGIYRSALTRFSESLLPKMWRK